MKLTEKIEFLQKNYFSEWINTRRAIEDKLSSSNPIFCMCGRLATGLHESHCRKFQSKVANDTVSALSHLLKGEK